MDDYATRMTEVLAERLINRRNGMAQRLRDMADEVERATPRTRLSDLNPSYASMAQDIDHAITWGIANLGVGNFAHDAAELDVLIAQESTNEPA